MIVVRYCVWDGLLEGCWGIQAEDFSGERWHPLKIERRPCRYCVGVMRNCACSWSPKANHHGKDGFPEPKLIK